MRYGGGTNEVRRRYGSFLTENFFPFHTSYPFIFATKRQTGGVEWGLVIFISLQTSYSLSLVANEGE
jgi:hypothetical protein